MFSNLSDGLSEREDGYGVWLSGRTFGSTNKHYQNLSSDRSVKDLDSMR